MTNFIRFLIKSFSELTRYPGFLIIAWVALTISLPFLRLLVGEQTFLQGLNLVILLQVAYVLNVLYRAWGWWSMLRVVASVLLLVWVVQAIVIRSGMPYGKLMYTAMLQPQLLGIPFIVPVTWLMMLPPSWLVARLITRKLTGCLLRLVFALVSAVAFTGWTFYFDPMLAGVGILQWTPAGNFFGTPLWNYVFWFFIAALLTFALSPTRLPGGPLLLMYALSWLVLFIALQIFGGFLWPSLIGFAIMGGVLIGAAANSE
jgi:uncharacterized membrane protein